MSTQMRPAPSLFFCILRKHRQTEHFLLLLQHRSCPCVGKFDYISSCLLFFLPPWVFGKLCTLLRQNIRDVEVVRSSIMFRKCSQQENNFKGRAIISRSFQHITVFSPLVVVAYKSSQTDPPNII